MHEKLQQTSETFDNPTFSFSLQRYLAAANTVTHTEKIRNQNAASLSIASMMQSNIYLPPELWSIVFGHLGERKSQGELRFLWTVLRLVCRQFQEETEALFCTKHLPKTWLHIDDRECISNFVELF